MGIFSGIRGRRNQQCYIQCRFAITIQKASVFQVISHGEPLRSAQPVAVLHGVIGGNSQHGIGVGLLESGIPPVNEGIVAGRVDTLDEGGVQISLKLPCLVYAAVKDRRPSMQNFLVEAAKAALKREASRRPRNGEME